MSWTVPLTEVALTDADVEAVVETLRSGWLTMGPRTLDLETAFAEFTGSTHAVAVGSGGAALHLACLAAGAGPGDEVIVPALSFGADPNAAIACGADPVFADSAGVLQPAIDAQEVESRIGPRTRAVIAVHTFGYPADADGLKATCDSHDVALIEDCAHAAGGLLHDGRRAGTVGAMGCFSFFAKTQLGAGEGGIVVTDDEELAAKVRSLRSHAMTSVTWDRHRGHAETYDVPDLGFNHRIDEPRATLALSRLRRLDEAVEKLREVVRAYRVRLSALEGVEVPFSDAEVELSGHFAFPVLVGDRETRDRVRTALHADGVQTTVYQALTGLTEYGRRASGEPCARAEEFADRHMALPLFTGLSEERITTVVDSLGSALAA
jgi:dTDP-4-amino-4,6-dideoxygalactose transaminase